MTTTSINLSRSTGLPELGFHLFKVIRVSENEDTASGYPTWYLTCQVQDKGDDQGKEVLHSLSLSPKARFKVDEFLDAIDAPRKGSSSAEAFVGKLFRANVTHGEWGGKPRAYLDSLLPAEGAFPSNVNLDNAPMEVEDFEDESEESDLETLDFNPSSDDMPF